jgi:hypothetical protein
VKKNISSISLFFIVILLAFACKDKKVRPDNLLPREEFVNILTDMHVTDAMLEHKGMQGDSLVMFNKANLDQILVNYHANRKAFDDTYRFYIQNPDDFDLIYLDVINKLSQMQADANK